MSSIDAIKRFFSTSERPVTTRELTEFKKADPKGFEAVAEAALQALQQPALQQPAQ